MPVFNDPWKELREPLFGNVEPSVFLDALTTPCLDIPIDPEMTTYKMMDLTSVEMLPAITASTSYDRREKVKTIEQARRLNKKLIESGHLTPFEAIQFNFYIEGISKACGAQLSRHRIGQGHVSVSRRFKEAKKGFIYPVFDYIENFDFAKWLLGELSSTNEFLYDRYCLLREPIEHPNIGDIKIKKEDSRLILPVSYSTSRVMWINARALRDLFRLRLAPDAEWEIRRLVTIIYNLVCPMMPSIFEDIGDKYVGKQTI